MKKKPSKKKKFRVFPARDLLEEQASPDLNFVPISQSPVELSDRDRDFLIKAASNGIPRAVMAIEEEIGRICKRATNIINTPWRTRAYISVTDPASIKPVGRPGDLKVTELSVGRVEDRDAIQFPAKKSTSKSAGKSHHRRTKAARSKRRTP